MEIENWPIDRPKDYPLNARRWTPRAIAKVADSLRRFGWRQPIVVDSADVIVIGHLRRTAARSIGFAECPVHIARDLSPEQIRALRLADNRTNEEAAWDESLLSAEFQQLQEMSFDLSATGFDMPEIAKFLGEASPAGDQSAPCVGALEFRVIVDCSGEAQQAELLSRFEGEGLVCRPLIS